MWIMWIKKVSTKTPFGEKRMKVWKYVDKLSAKQVFANIYNVSGAHSYQQITVYTIF